MINQENKIDEFKKQYDSNIEYYNNALSYYIEQISSIKNIESVSGRIKDYDECISKFQRKYLSTIAPNASDYKIVDYISDFIGIRIICLYLEDVPRIRKDLKHIFREIDSTDKANLLEKTDNKFGYKSLHLDLKLNRRNIKSSEAGKYANLHFELQIRTIIQDAWSVLDHKIKYKKSIPLSLKRRINRLSALFEIADDEFLNIKKEIVQAENKISERIKKGDAVERDKSLDVFRFLFIALKHFPDYNFIEFKVDGFVQEILNINKNLTESELNEALLYYLPVAEQIAKNENKLLNPYTKIRYCLFLSNTDLYLNLLSDYQKVTISSLNSHIL